MAVVAEEREPLGYGRSLISASRFGDWLLLIRALVVTVVPITAAGVIATSMMSGRNVLVALADAVLSTIETTVHLCFWTTLVYAFVDWRERAGESNLPEPPSLAVIDKRMRIAASENASRRVSLREVLVPLRCEVLAVSFMLNQRILGWRDAKGTVVPILNPDEWGFWFIAGLLCMTNAAATAVATYRMGRWTPLTTASLVLHTTAAGAIATWLLLSGRALNARWLARMDWLGDADRNAAAAWPLTVLVILGSLWVVWTGVAGWQRDRSAPPLRYR